ncbi:hypothetical protein MB02_02835 [Croceicoccus estronivorus]|uniref:hypothetical protein n=1 Tax=Croceicoccus estronivorus TaxID=1172626 RepID=UPI00082C572A|nr:hypothetical protein [Croceicoccus estronivorus]OCC25584.1 hypothetical protein MB02_02835 [Croceicoccus estronivorus]
MYQYSTESVAGGPQPDKIEPQAPPERPSPDMPAEAPVRNPAEAPFQLPETELPHREVPETPPPPD